MPDDLNAIVWPEAPFSIPDHLILAGYRGSQAHGTYVAPTEPTGIDDIDVVGIVIPPPPYYVGLKTWEAADRITPPWDVLVYEYRKAIRLLMAQNPNILSLLWLEPEDYLHIAPAGRALLTFRDYFQCKSKAYESFTGYARGQLKKMVMSGPYRGYMGAKRKALVDAHGWDCKNGSHLVRLLHMGCEYLATGRMTVKRTWDRDFLIAIKRGDYPLADVQAHAEAWFQRCDEAYANSPLPEACNVQGIEHLMMTAILPRLGLEACGYGK